MGNSGDEFQLKRMQRYVWLDYVDVTFHQTSFLKSFDYFWNCSLPCIIIQIQWRQFTEKRIHSRLLDQLIVNFHDSFHFTLFDYVLEIASAKLRMDSLGKNNIEHNMFTALSQMSVPWWVQMTLKKMVKLIQTWNFIEQNVRRIR